MLSTFGRTELRIPLEGGFQQPQDVYINDQVICAMGDVPTATVSRIVIEEYRQLLELPA
jgi:hypothetical protein